MMNEVKRRPDRARGNPWLQFLLVLVLLVVLAAMFTPVVMKCSKSAPMTTATSNAKQIFYLLVEFDQDFGRFPTDVTAVDELEGYRGEYSNDYLAQFIAGGYTKSEEIFYAKGGSGPIKKPDNIIDHRKDQLGEGECGFAYIKDLSTKSNPKTPVLLAPMYGHGYKFNSDAYEGKAVVLRIDGAVKQFRLNKDRHAVIGGGKTLFDAGPASVWGAKGFDSSKLCYAKKPYDFSPRLLPETNAKEWLMAVLALLIVFLIVRAVVHSTRRGARRKVGPDGPD